MRTSGNEPIVEVQRWKEGEWSVAINPVDNGYLPTINDPVYESLIPANVYSPTAYPAGWEKL